MNQNIEAATRSGKKKTTEGSNYSPSDIVCAILLLALVVGFSAWGWAASIRDWMDANAAEAAPASAPLLVDQSHEDAYLALDAALTSGREVLDSTPKDEVNDSDARTHLLQSLGTGQVQMNRYADANRMTQAAHIINKDARALTATHDEYKADREAERVAAEAAAKAEAERIAAEEAARVEAERVAAEEAQWASQEESAATYYAETEGSYSEESDSWEPSASGGDSGYTAPTVSSGRTWQSVAEGIAAQWGVGISWTDSQNCGYRPGAWGPNYTAVRGCAGGGSTIQLSTAGMGEDFDANPLNYYAADVVRHESAHVLIERTCGWVNPLFVGDRYENVTDAYANMYMGAGSASGGYGYNSTDAANAAKIYSGVCS